MTGQEVIACRDALKKTRQPLEQHWDELSASFMPFSLMATGGIPDILSAKAVYDSTGRRAALILANGLASLVIPREEIWFEYLAPAELRDDDDAVSFYRKASETARENLEASNFYEEGQEVLISSPVFGTAALFCGDIDDHGEIHFRHQPIKTYYITEDAKGRVNGFYRDLSLTPDQAAGEFGADKLPETIRAKVGKAEGKTEPCMFVHAVFQRMEDPKPDAPDKDKRPWVSLVVHEGSKEIVADDGYSEFPFAVHRYRRFGQCVWGFGPGTTACGDAHQLNFLNQLADVAAEKAVFPPVIAPSSLEGEVALGALEITYVDSNDPNSVASLKEWNTTSRYDVAKDRMADKREQIERAFHVDLFQLFASRAGSSPLTATEAAYAAGEKLSQFSPVFGRLVSEMLDPVLTRVFAVLLRAGKFPNPPASVLRTIEAGRAGVATPSVLYKNRIMLAMQARQNSSLMEYMQLAGPMLQVYPDAIDALNMPVIVRDTARNAGLLESWIRSKKEIEKMAADRAAARAQQAQLEQAQAASQVAKNIGGAPPQIQDQLGKQLPQ